MIDDERINHIKEMEDEIIFNVVIIHRGISLESEIRRHKWLIFRLKHGLYFRKDFTKDDIIYLETWKNRVQELINKKINQRRINKDHQEWMTRKNTR